MDIGLPQVDVIGILNGIYNFVKVNGNSIFNWILEVCGGNPVVAGIVIGFPVYLIIDFIYHFLLDKPAATLGGSMMRVATNAVLFIIVAVVAFIVWKGGL